MMLENINNGFAYVVKSKDIQITEIAKKLEIAKQNVSRWISGERNIPSKYLPILSEMLDSNIGFLLLNLTNDDKIKLLEEEIEKLKKGE
ncbi:helix-turn-helix transcriptional regulator [Clostridium sp.]|uniref:helix-turn-helix domain-containing protein n=1 Tax=Clostridium sp. TaxID=1506 RepID=UPI0026027B4E|nr:helix-turn-helix transcriptional regulator [Clostridium sp.]